MAGHSSTKGDRLFERSRCLPHGSIEYLGLPDDQSLLGITMAYMAAEFPTILTLAAMP